MDEEYVEEKWVDRGDWRVDKVEEIVVRYLQTYYENKPEKQVLDDKVMVVWFSKTLHSWRALAKVIGHKGTYFEVIHDGEKSKTYLNVYDRRHNIVIGW